jgi:hypothetical protein
VVLEFSLKVPFGFLFVLEGSWFLGKFRLLFALLESGKVLSLFALFWCI